MVEGHGVHRVARALQTRLMGRKLRATSPNGRFAAGAEAIDGLALSRVEAVGKNLFVFFGEGVSAVVVHVHFGMSGVWAIFDLAAGEKVPEPTATTRLRLEDAGVVSHLSAMTVVHGTEAGLYAVKRAQLGQDPLREDADVDALWRAVSKSKKKIGQLLMDQSVFAGPGNIYRAEILFVARIHPEVLGLDLSRAQLEAVWASTVALMRAGFLTGSIVTVEEAEARALRTPGLRRWIYNRASCGRCSGPVLSWAMDGRTCYACPSCQHRPGAHASPAGAGATKVFNSRCAREPSGSRLAEGGGAALTVAELRAELRSLGLDSAGVKAQLVARLEAALALSRTQAGFTSALDASREKARAGESRAVEHLAELAPQQHPPLEVKPKSGSRPTPPWQTKAAQKRAAPEAEAEAEGEEAPTSLTATMRQRKARV